MRIAIGSDHTGVDLKRMLSQRLRDAGHEIHDFGTHSDESVDYPDIVAPLAAAVVNGRDQLGIVLCSNGVGVSIAANKVNGVRAALCADPWTARRARQHTDANILAIGAWVTGRALAQEIVDNFVNASFEGGRHVRRLAKLAAIENEQSEPAAEPTIEQPAATDAEASPAGPAR